MYCMLTSLEHCFKKIKIVAFLFELGTWGLWDSYSYSSSLHGTFKGFPLQSLRKLLFWRKLTAYSNRTPCTPFLQPLPIKRVHESHGKNCTSSLSKYCTFLGKSVVCSKKMWFIHLSRKKCTSSRKNGFLEQPTGRNVSQSCTNHFREQILVIA